MITELDFYKSWVKICEKPKNMEKLLMAWYYPTDFTHAMLHLDDSILNQVSQDIGIAFYREYYHIDAVFYDKNDCIHPNPKYKTWGNFSENWLTKILIAFEHENNIKTAFQEISHLIITNAEAKVLVTYSDKCEVDNHAYDFSTILNKSDFNPILLILGNREKKQDKEVIVWNGYILSEGKYEKI